MQTPGDETVFLILLISVSERGIARIPTEY